MFASRPCCSSLIRTLDKGSFSLVRFTAQLVRSTRRAQPPLRRAFEPLRSTTIRMLAVLCRIDRCCDPQPSRCTSSTSRANAAASDGSAADNDSGHYRTTAAIRRAAAIFCTVVAGAAGLGHAARHFNHCHAANSPQRTQRRTHPAPIGSQPGYQRNGHDHHERREYFD